MIATPIKGRRFFAALFIAGGVALIAIFALSALAPAAAKEINRAREYRSCMALAKKTPQEGFDAALSWRGLGGGDAAEHCLATALIGLGHYQDAAGRLETLAGKAKENAKVKAGLLTHAAQAWLLGDNPARAEAVLTAALKLTPTDSALLVDRAQARAGQKDFEGALEDLNRSIEREDRRPDAFVFRATAYRFLDKLEPALADVERALALSPKHPDGLLERGILRRLRNDKTGARQDWLAVLRVAPGTPAAEAARSNLEKMDVNPGQGPGRKSKDRP